VTAKRREFIKGKHLFKNDEFEGVANAKGSYKGTVSPYCRVYKEVFFYTGKEKMSFPVVLAFLFHPSQRKRISLPTFYFFFPTGSILSLLFP